MQGVVRGKGTPVQFQYEQGMQTDTYTTVIDGETFIGKAVFADARTGIGYGIGGGATATFIGTSYSGNLVATLLGNRGSTMRCNMNYADSSGYTPSGGVGVCQHSDGRIIDVLW